MIKAPILGSKQENKVNNTHMVVLTQMLRHITYG